MRAAIVAVFVGVVLALAPSAVAKDAGFLDLPGIGSLERLTDAKAPAASSVTTTTGAATTSKPAEATDRAPAPAATKALDAKDATDSAAVSAADTAMIRSLPGARNLPVIGVDPASSTRGADGMAFALAVAVVVLFTRFLVRLNTLGRSA